MTIMAGVVDEYRSPTEINYVTFAVHFDGSAFLRRTAPLTGWGTPDKFTWVCWTRLTFQFAGLFQDQSNFYCIADPPFPGPSFWSCLFGGGLNDGFSTTIPVLSAGWQSLICSVDATNQIIRFYSGDTDVLDGGSVFFDGTPGTPVGTDFYFMNDGTGSKLAGDIADFRLWVGGFVDLSVFGNRRMFVRQNGKPADPTAALALLGTPIVSFVSTGNTASFAANGGSGGAFTLSGSLSMAGTSPTD